MKSDPAIWSQQELAAGQSLGALVQGGWRHSEREVERIAREMLGILQYLGSRQPPVTHGWVQQCWQELLLLLLRLWGLVMLPPQRHTRCSGEAMQL